MHFTIVFLENEAIHSQPPAWAMPSNYIITDTKNGQEYVVQHQKKYTRVRTHKLGWQVTRVPPTIPPSSISSAPFCRTGFVYHTGRQNENDHHKTDPTCVSLRFRLVSQPSATVLRTQEWPEHKRLGATPTLRSSASWRHEYLFSTSLTSHDLMGYEEERANLKTTGIEPRHNTRMQPSPNKFQGPPKAHGCRYGPYKDCPYHLQKFAHRRARTQQIGWQIPWPNFQTAIRDLLQSKSQSLGFRMHTLPPIKVHYGR